MTRAAVLREVGASFEEEEIQLAPVGPRDVLVRIAASGVCHSDLSVQQGRIPFMFPTVLGHEGAGVVAEVGQEVTRVAAGDHVVLTWMPPCRNCFWCLRGQPMLCEHGLSESLGRPYASVGGVKLVRGLGTATFATETLVPDGSVVPIDPSVPLEMAALVGCALSTGTGAVWRTAAVPPGATVAVVGCGGVGLAVVRGAALAGASTVVAVDNVASKLELARAMGASAVVDASGQDPVAAVKEHTGGRGADYAFEVVGRPETIRCAFDATRRGGTTVLVGAGSPADVVEFNAFELFVDAKTVVGCVYGSTDPDRDFPALADLVGSGRIDAGAMVSRRIGLGDLDDAFRAMTAGEVARSMVVFEQEAK
ncbi:MAG TPA: Zn-dependent alcohol dehydrogenase [Acidimicrobiales bacterium]|nr:Zn-dependent alcohol dehydrogenase [Acidimicrobiales bacterium]